MLHRRSGKLMLAVLILVVGSASVFVVLLLVIVVIGIRQEPATEELSQLAPSLIAAFVRRLLGLHVRKPYPPPNLRVGDNGHASALHDPAHRPNEQAGEVKKLLQAYTVEQVAEMLHVGRDKVYYLLRTGQLRSIKIGKLRRITEQHLAAFIASREDVADAS
jgi:excisionase family DNA binding protein